MSSSSESIDLDGLASSLTEAFIRGEYSKGASASLRALLPGVSYLSISVVAGDKVMVTEENLLRAGFASIQFDRLDETVGGQALLSGRLFEAKRPSSRSYADLDRAHAKFGCSSLVSQPIPRPKSMGRRASFDSNSDSPRPSFSAAARMSSRSNSGATTQDDCSEHFGAFSQRREQAPMGCISIGLPEDAQPSMTQLNSMKLLAGILAPILEQQSRTVLEGLKTAFGQARLDGATGADASPSHAAPPQVHERWSSAQGVDDMVDSMLQRGSPSDSCSNEHTAQT